MTAPLSLRHIVRPHLSLLSALALAVGCSGGSDGAAGDGGMDDAAMGDAAVGDGDGDGDGSGGAGGGDGDGDAPSDPCVAAGDPCAFGQRCDTDGDAPACVDNTCDDLTCQAGEDCRQVDGGGGFVCVADGCATNADCDPEEYCDVDTCRLDVCESLTRTCDGDMVLSCDAVGGGEDMLFSCQSGGYFTSECVSGDDGEAACGCEGDWDCPQFTQCEVNVCVGTGREAMCTLPPVDFESVPPALELHWGGDDPGDTAHDGTLPSDMAPDAPWPEFTHVVNTPMVANLDDDNGDGLINELDFPEIIFMAHQGNNPWDNAVVRAIHGGGAAKGADYFARCGDLLWQEGDAVATGCADATDPTADAGAPVAVGDLDGDGKPEIVVPLGDDTFQILDNTGELVYTLPAPWAPAIPEGETIAIANLDFAGYAELIIGPHVYLLGDDPDDGSLIVTHFFVGGRSVGWNTKRVGYMACPADLDPDRAGLEIAVGTTLYALPSDIATCGTPPCDGGALDVVWHAPDVGSQIDDLNDGDQTDDGFCAVADVWGADFNSAPGPDNPPDGQAEVVLIANGRLVTLSGADGTLIDIRSLGGGRGGAPNVDDFDGDGYMEVASALQDYYIVLDLQDPEDTHCPAWDTVLPEANAGANPNTQRMPGGVDVDGTCGSDGDCNAGAVCGAQGTCVCLHNGWRRGSDDGSSRATSSSVFDFNGDGSAEVVYNDECELRVYRGRDGTVLYSEASRSRTGIENPVVADVDNDGNAEIVVGSNNAVNGRCDADGDTPTGVNGIRVFGDPTDTWVASRRIWNQQSYHVTNVTEGGGIPPHEAESWVVLNGRTYNTYRSQPRSSGVAPDLSIVGISVAALGGGCAIDLVGENLDEAVRVSFEVRNLGDLRVGPGVDVLLVGLWDAEGLEEALLDGNGDPIEVTLQSSLEPGASVILSVEYDVMNNDPGRLPDTIRVIVDPGPPDTGRERECDEDNNSLDYVPADDAEQADLRLTIADVKDCPDATVTATLYNDGVEITEDIVIAWYAGNPSQGGTRIGETTLEGGLGAGESTDITGLLEDFPARGDVTVYGVVDPQRTLPDCSRDNNTAAAPDTHTCAVILQ